MNEFVADTMAIVLHLEKRKSGTNVKQILTDAENGNAVVHVPAIVFAEILYLSEKKPIVLTLSDVENHLSKFPNFRSQELSFEIVKTAETITDIPELHDRLIAATAKHLGLKLITNDPKIQNSAFVKTVW
jgi:predicted nucleic acid-binding protein